MALTADIATRRVGAEGAHQPVAAPMGANVTVFQGSIGLIASTGYLKNADVPAATDVIAGIIAGPAGGTYVNTGSGIVNGAVAGAVSVECATGTFLLASAGAADQLSVATTGETCYVVNETQVGATNGGGTRPIAGVQLPSNPGDPTGYFQIKLSGFAGEGP